METIELPKTTEVVVGITDYDNRWNKVAVEIAKERLHPTAPTKPKEESPNEPSSKKTDK